MKQLPTETLYLAGGCLWGVQEFLKHLPGVVETEAGRANGTTQSTKTAYDGYAECVKTTYDSTRVSMESLIEYFFEIIDPYSVNQQGNDVGEKYRTGIYSTDQKHLSRARTCIEEIEQALNQENGTRRKVAVEVLLLSNYILSDAEHQDRLTLHPDDHVHCHIPLDLMYKYRK